MNSMKKTTQRLAGLVILTAAGLTLSGCPYGPGLDGTAEYDLGFAEGFAQDNEYWLGFDDSYYTVDGLWPPLYSGSEIPNLADGTYDAGYWDGVWYAYNDGYFVAYDYAFTIGFSEGYDLAFYPDWPDFLLNDVHVEWLDGGFTDGYNDGFSEGRILGAVDYDSGFPFDWLDAMNWYREGNDAYIELIGLGTGLDGPVFLYEYGTDPLDLIQAKKSTAPVRTGRQPLSIRKPGAGAKAEAPALSYRALDSDAKNLLRQRPLTSTRSERALTLNTTWLERVQAYQATRSN